MNRRNQSWLESENILLKKHWGSKTLEQLSNLLGRSESGVEQQAEKLGLPKVRDNRVPVEIVEYIRTNADTMSGSEIGEKFGYSASRVYGIAQRYGIRFRKD